MAKVEDLTGRIFGYGTVKDRADSQGGNACWSMICICGTEYTARADVLKRGTKTSCGCGGQNALLHTAPLPDTTESVSKEQAAIREQAQQLALTELFSPEYFIILENNTNKDKWGSRLMSRIVLENNTPWGTWGNQFPVLPWPISAWTPEQRRMAEGYEDILAAVADHVATGAISKLLKPGENGTVWMLRGKICCISDGTDIGRPDEFLHKLDQ